jgi:Predicted dinucleotide-binding enzymes
MRIGIVGSGKIGGTLARRFSQLGHDVTLTNSRGPESLRDFAQETGVTAGTLSESVVGAEVVVIAIPLKAVVDLPADLIAGITVIDANNYYARRDGEIAELATTPSTRWTADRFPGGRFVKAFNNILWEHLGSNGRPSGTPGRIALPIAADDADAKRLVSELVDALGFDPVDAGGLDNSWRQQPDTGVYGTDLDADGVRRVLAAEQR